MPRPTQKVEGPTGEGYFTEAARSAAIQHALPYLATYVADSPTWGIKLRSAVGTAEREIDDLRDFVNMRVAIAAARRLEECLRPILTNPSFYYSTTAEESPGAIRGQLDVPRYIRSKWRRESPRRYPIRVLRRRYATDENTLAAYAILRVLGQLRRAPLSVLPPGAPEKTAVLELRSRLLALMSEPAMVEAKEGAYSTMRRGNIQERLARTERRLSSGRVASVDRYLSLLDWIRGFERGPADAVAGEVEWAFYDSRFDSKLYEIWCLRLVIDSLSTRLGPPGDGIRPLHDRRDGPISLWRVGLATLAVHFQFSLAKLGLGEPRWRYTAPSQHILQGFPDIAVIIDKVDLAREVVLIDPKLRERAHSPTEEIYKLLGYFMNITTVRTMGAIIFLASDLPRRYELQDGSSGWVQALGLDPLRLPESCEQIDRLVETILDAASIPSDLAQRLAAAQSAGDPDAVEELVTSIVQKAATQSLVQAASGLPPSALDPYRKTTQAQLYQIWDSVSPAVATMIVTAEYFGHSAPSDADHSGPLLGLAAACERTLYDGLMDAMLRRRPDLFRDTQTFGMLIRYLSDAVRSRPMTPEGQALAETLAELPTPERQALERLIPDLRILNTRYRIPAAHRELVDQRLWMRGRSHVLDPTLGVLTRLVTTLATYENGDGE